MIYKKVSNERRLASYAEERAGKFITADGEHIEYRLSYLPELALLGKRKELEQEIEKGAPVLGLDMEIVARLKRGMSLRGKVAPISGWAPYEEQDSREVYTTLDAAVCGGQYKVLKMLIKKGAKFDLRCRRLREFYYLCPSEEILKLAFEKEEYHWEMLDYSEILERGSESNIKLMEMMYRRGIPLPENVLHMYREGTHYCDDKDLVMRFLEDKCNSGLPQGEGEM